MGHGRAGTWTPQSSSLPLTAVLLTFDVPTRISHQPLQSPSAPISLVILAKVTNGLLANTVQVEVLTPSAQATVRTPLHSISLHLSPLLPGLPHCPGPSRHHSWAVFRFLFSCPLFRPQTLLCQGSNRPVLLVPNLRQVMLRNIMVSISHLQIMSLTFAPLALTFARALFFFEV